MMSWVMNIITFYSTIIAIIILTSISIKKGIEKYVITHQKKDIAIAILAVFTMLFSFTLLYYPINSDVYFYMPLHSFFVIQTSMIPLYIFIGGRKGIPASIVIPFYIVFAQVGIQAISLVFYTIAGIAIYYALSDLSYRKIIEYLSIMFVIPTIPVSILATALILSIFTLSKDLPNKSFALAVFGVALLVGATGYPIIVYHGPVIANNQGVAYTIPQGHDQYVEIHGEAITYNTSFFIITKTHDIDYVTHSIRPSIAKNSTLIDVNLDWIGLFTIFFLVSFFAYYFDPDRKLFQT